MTEQASKPRTFPIGRIVFILVGAAVLIYMIINGIATWQGAGSPIAFNLGPLHVRWYGILLMAGAFAGALLGEAEARRRGLDVDHVWNILLWGLILGVVISRLWYLPSNWSYFSQNPLRIIGFEGGKFEGLSGLTIHGALIGALLAAFLYTRWAKQDFWKWLDVAIPGFALGQAIGRWGNFFNQEAYGWRTNLPWGLRIAVEHRINALNWLGNILPEYSKLQAGSPVCNAPNLACYTDITRFPFETTRFHPTFLYESLWNVGMVLLLLYIARRFGPRLVRGEIFWFYGALYAVGRFGLEFLRIDSEYLGRYPAGQVVSIAILLVCALFFVLRRFVWRRATWAESEEKAAATPAPAVVESPQPAEPTS